MYKDNIEKYENIYHDERHRTKCVKIRESRKFNSCNKKPITT